MHHPTYVKNEERSTNVIVSNLSGDKIIFSTFYTDLFLLFGKKLGGGPPLATALIKQNLLITHTDIKRRLKLLDDRASLRMYESLLGYGVALTPRDIHI